jgi:hypothetical protein
VAYFKACLSVFIMRLRETTKSLTDCRTRSRSRQPCTTLFSSRFLDTGKCAIFTRTPREPPHYAVLNPKPVLADTTHSPLYPLPEVTYTKKSNSFDFLVPVLKHARSLKRPVLVRSLAVLPVATTRIRKPVEKERSVWGYV